MATFNFYLREPNSLSQTPIVLFVVSEGKTTKIRTGEKIDPKHWDAAKQRIKRSYTGSPELNEYLSSFLLKAQAVYRSKRIEGIEPGSEQLRKAIELPPPANSTTKEASENFIKIISESMQKTTVKKFETLFNHLKDFHEKKRSTFSFESIDLDFFDSFQNFLRKEKKHNNNTVAKYVTALKTFMQWAFDRELHSNLTFKKFKVKEFEKEVVYLTEKELFGILHLDLKAKPHLKKVRDAFCFGCFTGQRFSDISNISWDAIKNGVWEIRTQKTKDIIQVPLNKYALSLINKNKSESKPVTTISNQKMNAYLKDIAEMAKINDKVKVVSYSGNEKSESYEIKHKLISTHTARRSFVTLSLEKGMRPEMVMEITGHKDFKTMKRYLKITSKVKELEMNKIWN